MKSLKEALFSRKNIQRNRKPESIICDDFSLTQTAAELEYFDQIEIINTENRTKYRLLDLLYRYGEPSIALIKDKDFVGSDPSDFDSENFMQLTLEELEEVQNWMLMAICYDSRNGKEYMFDVELDTKAEKLILTI